MKIYVSHSRNFDYLNELYKPLKEAGLPVEFIFPHEDGSESFDAKDLFQNHKVDYVLAEVSQPATGQGIELGWADIFGVPIICFYKSGTKPARSLMGITGRIIEYGDSTDLINKLVVELGLNIA
ncbi:MAG: hypothetical protein Q7T54_03775 [Candidatus Levybacteria bacterium]|nr:hypothetical protein [Candidatus Levybacteria bacterium]